MAERIYDQLPPYAGLRAISYAQAPYDGPVALTVGRLATWPGRTDEGRRHLEAARRSCEELQALPYLALRVGFCHQLAGSPAAWLFLSGPRAALMSGFGREVVLGRWQPGGLIVALGSGANTHGSFGIA